MDEIKQRVDILDEIETMGKGATVKEFDAFVKDYGGGIEDYKEFREVGGTMKEFNQMKEQMIAQHGEDSVHWLNMSDYVEAKKEGKPLDGVIAESGKNYVEYKKEEKENEAEIEAEEKAAKTGVDTVAENSPTTTADKPEDVEKAKAAAAETGAAAQLAKTGAQQQGEELKGSPLVQDGSASLAATKSAEASVGNAV